MKQIFIFLFSLFLFSSTLMAQTVLPQAMKYQAVARDAEGLVMGNKNISLKISLLSGSIEGRTLYAEIHEVTTSPLGLFDLTIGQGQVSKGQFAEIPWSSEEIWMDIAIDENGGDAFSSISTTRLLAVPYAFHAGSADRLTSEEIGSDDPEGRFTGPFWKSQGNAGVFAPFQFLGTVDANDLVFKTNNQERMTLAANGDISMSGPLSLLSDLSVDGIATFNNTTQSTTKDNGSVIVEGGVGIEKNVNIGGDLTVTGKSNLNDQVTITADINATNGEADQTNYPLIVKGGAQGIAIQVDADKDGGALDRNTNFLTCFDGSGDPMGRIEGFQAINDANALANGFNDLTFFFPASNSSFF